MVAKNKTNTVVVNKRHSEFDVDISRASKWGNPFRIGKDGTREEVIEKYFNYILDRSDLMVNLGELKGKRLGCYCKPEACHGDVLVEMINDIFVKD